MIEQTSQNISNGIKLSVSEIPKLSSFKFKKNDAKYEVKPKEVSKKSPSYITMFAAEFIGTAILMFMGCMGCVSQFDTPPAFHHMGAIAFGLTVMLVIQMFGHISGAHLNPAVTIATVVLGDLEIKMSIVYILAQFIGAILGFGLLKILLPDEYVANGFCVTTLHQKINIFQGLAIEVVITTILILVCCAVWDKRNSDKPDSTPLRFGFIIATIAMAAGPLTGASMNTARSVAPLIFGGNWNNQWIYWVGPNVASILACLLYRVLFSVRSENVSVKEENIFLEDVTGLNFAEKV